MRLFDETAIWARSRGEEDFPKLHNSRPLRLRIAKRTMDIAGSLLALTVVAPLALGLGLILWLVYRQPPLYRQLRTGLNGAPFRIVKFRTMWVADADGAVTPAAPDDERVTPLGRLLRRYSLDELPQLWNVLKGEMSLVGPRPYAVSMSDRLPLTAREAALRLSVPPGMTGAAQIAGLRGPIDDPAHMRARLRVDLDYVQQASPWLDLKILRQTLPAIWRGENAC